jgi:hypothetical protein
MQTALLTVIRCSSLSGYPDCPRRGAARLFRHEIEDAGFTLRQTPRGIAAAIGTAVHTGAEIPLLEKATTGRLPPESVALDAATWTLGSQFRDGEEITFDGTRGVTHNRVQAERQVIGMTRAYFRTVAPALNPIHVEERLEAEIAPGVILSGQPDQICREPHKIRDLKTGRKPSGTHAPQVGGYSLLARSNGLDIESAAVDFIQRVPIHKPQPDPVTEQVTVAQAETAASAIIKHMIGDLDTFRHGDPERRILPGDPWAFPANPASMLCSPKFCPAHGTEFCHEGRKE